MVTPAAPRSRITSAALISILVRVSPRFLRACVANDMDVLSLYRPAGRQAAWESRSCGIRHWIARGLNRTDRSGLRRRSGISALKR
jgi:hypothetical protein